MNILPKCFLIINLISSCSYALPIGLSTCDKNINTTLTNLNNARFQNKFYIKTKFPNLLSPEIKDAYPLSLPLLISAQLGNKILYLQSLIRMNQAMKQLDPEPFKAWMYGRMLFAAHSIKDQRRETEISFALKTLISNLTKEDSTRLDRFTTWSLGYYAALSKANFNETKDLLNDGGNYLTTQYFKTLSSGASIEKVQESRSDALWAWVLILQAAANGADEDVYNYAVEQILEITKKATLGQALTVGLLRTAASNDYPAWALGIAAISAQTIENKDQYDEALSQLNTSIDEAKKGNNLPEALLALVNRELAIERMDAMNRCPVAKL